MEMEMDREGLGSAFLRVELLRRQLLRPHFIELGLTVLIMGIVSFKWLKIGSYEPEGACRPVCA